MKQTFKYESERWYGEFETLVEEIYALGRDLQVAMALDDPEGFERLDTLAKSTARALQAEQNIAVWIKGQMIWKR